MDLILPFVFGLTTKIAERPQSKVTQQDSFLVKIFGAKLLSACVYFYASTPWNEFLDADVIEQIIFIQLGTSFLHPLYNLLDIEGLLSRHVLARYFSTTQEEMNSYWNGTDWQLSEQYSDVSKVRNSNIHQYIAVECLV